MAKSIIQNEKRCFVTYSTTGLHKHHIFKGANRNNSEKYGCWVWLRYDWHNGADYGVHGKNGHALDIRLKQIAQEKFEEKYSHELFMQVFKRNYLE
ncbi:MAG: hypothetical protein DBY26_06750 [Amedibacillus dolichus]|jgi:hypothetical protein|nr:MAG: hypothetical protein DBY26_06750 [Amedibacillus dolichus]DAV20222.1 MAG TPA: hypothetical protein [Caudoviricetes sp.]